MPIHNSNQAPSATSGSIEAWIEEQPALPISVSSFETPGKRRIQKKIISKKRGQNDDDWEVQQAGHKRKTGSALFAEPSTPPQSNPRLSSPSFVISDSSNKSSPDGDVDGSGRCGEALYGLVLKNHGVVSDYDGILLPEDLRRYARDMMNKSRESPGPSCAQLRAFAKRRTKLDNKLESIVQYELLALTPLFPAYQTYLSDSGEELLERSQHCQFRKTSVPCNEEHAAVPLVNPKPDVFYGYTPDAFEGPSSSQTLSMMQRSVLKDYADPTTSGSFWPFFVTEFKSLRGNIFEAVNQIAGAGASCVNAVQTLLELAYPGEIRATTESLAFSCTANTMDARIWIHWKSLDPANASTPFIGAQLEQFNLCNPERVVAFRSSLLNIMDWALGERLTLIKDALIAYAALDYESGAVVLPGLHDDSVDESEVRAGDDESSGEADEQAEDDESEGGSQEKGS